MQLESLEERNLLAGLTVAIAEASISENGGAASAIVTRDSGTSGDLVVDLASDDMGEATVPTTVTIPDGQDSAPFMITGVDEDVVDLTQNVTITASAAGFTPGTDTIDITNDDRATLSVGNATVVEGNGGTTMLSFPVTLDAVVDVDVSVEYTTQDGTASAADGDYVAVTTPATFTMNAGETLGTIDITVNGDTLVEYDETLSLHLSNIQSKGHNLSFDWEQLGQKIKGESAFEMFGESASISADGKTLAVGAPYSDGGGTNSGSTNVYHFDGTSWIQLGQKIDGAATEDRFGYAVSLSGDGRTLAIGAPLTDISGDIGWSMLGQEIDGEAAVDQFGSSVSLSGDGDVVAIGTPFSNPGEVRVYRLQALATGTISDIDSLSVEFSQSMGMDMESSGGNLPHLLVTGTIQAGHSVTIDATVVGGTATGGGEDYNEPTTVTIAAGTYNATAVAITGLLVTPDTLIESDETIELGILPGSQIQVGDANGDGTTQTATQYTFKR